MRQLLPSLLQVFLCPFLCICRKLTKSKHAKLGHFKIPLKTIGYIHLGPTSKGPRHALLCRLKERFIFVTSSMPAGALYTVHSLYFHTLFLRWKPKMTLMILQTKIKSNTFSPNHGKPFVSLESGIFRELLSKLLDSYQSLVQTLTRW